MKKLLCALLAVLMLVSLCACGKEDTPAVPDNTEPVAPVEAALKFVDNGVKVELKADPATLEALGEPMDKSEEASCAFEGKDITYFYSNYEILVAAPANADSYIASIILKSDAVATEEGLEIGMPVSKLSEIYPDGQMDDPLFIVTKGDTQLRIKTADDTVTGIEYTIPSAATAPID